MWAMKKMGLTHHLCHHDIFLSLPRDALPFTIDSLRVRGLSSVMGNERVMRVTGALIMAVVGSYDMFINLIIVDPDPCSVRRNGTGELVVE